MPSCTFWEWWVAPSYGGYVIGTWWKDSPQTLNMLSWTQLKTDPELDQLNPWIVSNYIDDNFLNDNRGSFTFILMSRRGRDTIPVVHSQVRNWSVGETRNWLRNTFLCCLWISRAWHNILHVAGTQWILLHWMIEAHLCPRKISCTLLSGHDTRLSEILWGPKVLGILSNPYYIQIYI